MTNGSSLHTKIEFELDSILCIVDRWFWRYFLMHPEDIILDVEGKIFHTLHGVKPDQIVAAVGQPGTFFSNITKTAPCILHGNGMGKFTLKKVIDSLEAEGWLTPTNRSRVYVSDVGY